MSSNESPSKQASLIAQFARDNGLTEGLEFLHKVDLQESKEVSFEYLASRPNHPVTAVFKESLFHFKGYNELVAAFTEAAMVASSTYKRFYKPEKFYNAFSFLVPVSHIIDPDDYEEDEDEDDNLGDFYLYPQDAIELESDKDMEEVADATSSECQVRVIVRAEVDEDSDIDPNEEEDEVFELEYPSAVRLYKAMQLFLSDSEGIETELEAFAEVTVTKTFEV